MCLSERKRGTVSSILICALKGTPAKHTRGGVGRVKARHPTSEWPHALLAAAACACALMFSAYRGDSRGIRRFPPTSASISAKSAIHTFYTPRAPPQREFSAAVPCQAVAKGGACVPRSTRTLYSLTIPTSRHVVARPVGRVFGERRVLARRDARGVERPTSIRLGLGLLRVRVRVRVRVRG